MTQETKFCPDCGVERPLSEFYRVKNAASAGGYRYGSYCKEHANKRVAETRRNAPADSPTREAARRASAAYDERNPENRRERVARHRTKKQREHAARKRAEKRGEQPGE